MEVYAERTVVLVKMHGFVLSLELFYNTVGIFWVIFGNLCFYVREIGDCQGCLSRTNGQIDGLCKINETVENILDIMGKILSEASDFRSIRDFVKPTKFSKIPEIVKKQEVGLRRDGKIR